MRKQLTRVAALICLIIMSFSMITPASAATTPEDDASVWASNYLSYYTAWASAGSGGKIYIYYDVDATNTVARLGAKLIVVQVLDAGSWKNVLTKTGTVANGMLIQNDTSHIGNITYGGTPGKTYRAVVTIYGGPVSGGDSRIITTNSVVAKS